MTVAAESGSGRWRVIAFPHQFLTADGSVSGTVIVGLDVTSVYTHDRPAGRHRSHRQPDRHPRAGRLSASRWCADSLRPLTEIEQTAEAIAAGDLSRRVPERDPRTEVGRLGRSLNAMLSQIETAFHARSASEAAARRSEERMRQFVADASHELRTPLTAIRGFAEYYRQRGGVANGRPDSSGPENSGPGGSAVSAAGQDGPDRELPAAGPGVAAPTRGTGPLAPADLDRIMRRVEQESSRMGVLVEDMLLLARLDQQRPLEHRPVDLLTLAADAVHDARVVAPQRSINLTVGAGAALLVLGDEVRLRQVIGNLMSNALTHTPDGTPIDVRIRSGTLDEGRADAGRATLPPPGPGAETSTSPPAVILEVADRGPGLTTEQAERAFERFYRADQARTSRRAAAGSAWPSWPRSSWRMAAGCASSRRRAAAPRSASRSRWLPRHSAPRRLAPRRLARDSPGQPDGEPPAGPGHPAG